MTPSAIKEAHEAARHQLAAARYAKPPAASVASEMPAGLADSASRGTVPLAQQQQAALNKNLKEGPPTFSAVSKDPEDQALFKVAHPKEASAMDVHFRSQKLTGGG
jgi:hypothetical protein